MTTQSAIENIIENFNWEKVHNTMLALDWKWATYNSGTEVPSIGALVVTAQNLLHDACFYALKNLFTCCSLSSLQLLHNKFLIYFAATSPCKAKSRA